VISSHRTTCPNSSHAGVIILTIFNTSNYHEHHITSHRISACSLPALGFKSSTTIATRTLRSETSLPQTSLKSIFCFRPQIWRSIFLYSLLTKPTRTSTRPYVLTYIPHPSTRSEFPKQISRSRCQVHGSGLTKVLLILRCDDTLQPYTSPGPLFIRS
jgi:hypothetical protein